MTRKDYDQLALILGLVLKTGELSERGFRVICSELDANNANFNRDRFEAAVIPQSGTVREKVA